MARAIRAVLPRIILAMFCLLTASKVYAASDERVALIIGNSQYAHVSDLPNPANDAVDIASALERLGFNVTIGTDFDFRQMRLALRDFSEKAEGADFALVYFAGHGIEIANTNFLIPVNAELKSDRDVEFETIQLSALVNSVQGAKGVRLVLVDACRNNPFIANMNRTSATRSIGRGLSRIDPGGTLVGYAARSGTLALDGEGRNSPYAEAILKHIEQPGLELGKMFRKIRDTVFESTEGYQEPFTYGSLPGTDIFLKAPLATTETDGIASDVSSVDQRQIDDYARAEVRNSIDAWTSFLRKYDAEPEDQLVALAQSKLERLKSEATAKDSGNLDLSGLELSRLREHADTASAEQSLAALAPVQIEERLGLTREDLKRIQSALNAIGYNLGPVDGVLGTRSRSALRSFQVRARLPQSGYLTEDTISALVKTLADVPRTYDGRWRVTVFREWLVDNPYAPTVDRKGSKSPLVTVLLRAANGRFYIDSFDYKTIEPDTPFYDFEAVYSKEGKVRMRSSISTMFADGRIERPQMNKLVANFELPEFVPLMSTLELPANKFDRRLRFHVKMTRLE